MKKFAVIDVETTWYDKVMSIGIVIADSENFEIVDRKYYIVEEESIKEGMYSYALRDVNCDYTVECNHNEAVADIIKFLQNHEVISLFAYKASFDYKHLPELGNYSWFDIMQIAADCNFNTKIDEANCWSTGRLRTGYGVENMLRLLFDSNYCESHNSLKDAEDELMIMKLLQVKIDEYIPYKPKEKKQVSAAQGYRLQEKKNYIVRKLPNGTIEYRLKEEVWRERKKLLENELLSKFKNYISKVSELTQGAIELKKLTGRNYNEGTFECVKCGKTWTEKVEVFLKNDLKCQYCER